MRRLALTLVAASLVWTAACVRSADPERPRNAAPGESTLVGQLLLPRGAGSRGVELRITRSGHEHPVDWVLFDEQGRFKHTFGGVLTGVTVSAASEVHRIDSADLPPADPAGRIDLGVIDLRERLTERRLLVRAAEGQPPGEVRVGMWFHPPPSGPQGEPVSLGSRQFPPVALGSEMAWLVPNEAHSIYFLVERPSGPGRGTNWRSGHQKLFGPFGSARWPAELLVD